MPGSHPKGYYTATKTELIEGHQGKWFTQYLKKSDSKKNAFRDDLAERDPDHGPIKFTTNFTEGDYDTEVQV